METSIAEMRAFNRYYTSVLGLLDKSMLKSGFALAEARVIYELWVRGTIAPSLLAAELGMDPAQLSRLTTKLKNSGLVDLSRGENDKREILARLTRSGTQAALKLDEMSQSLVAGLVEHLEAPKIARVITAMNEIQTLLSGHDAVAHPVKYRHLKIGDIGQLIHRQAQLYHQEFGWNAEFEALIAKLYAEFEMHADKMRKKLWIAEAKGKLAGSIYIVPSNDQQNAAQLRMLYVEPQARGMGIGQELVRKAIKFSKDSGFQCVRLWTQDCLSSARRIYQKNGFVLVDQHRHHAFGCDLNGQIWELKLPS